MIQTRYSVFETNSSSVHSICICSKNEYDCWADELPLITKESFLWDDYSERLVSIEEILSYIPISFEEAERIGFSCINTNHYMTKSVYSQSCYKKWYNDYEEKFTSPSGDKMIAFGYYGHD